MNLDAASLIVALAALATAVLGYLRFRSDVKAREEQERREREAAAVEASTRDGALDLEDRQWVTTAAREDNARLRAENRDLREEVDKMETRMDEMEARMRELERVNRQLQLHVERCEADLAALRP